MILSGYGSSASVGKMQGFGNSFQTSESVGERMAKGFSSVMDKLLIEDRNPKLQNEYLIEGSLQYQPVKIEHQSSENSNENFNLRSEEDIKDIKKTKLQRVHMPGKAGGGWDDDDYKENQDTKDKNTGSSISKDSLEKVESISQVDYAEEQKIVEQFTHQDASFPPTSAEIIEARNCCLRLNCDKIIDFLVQRFQLPEVNIKMRCLVLLETLLHHDITSIEIINKVFMEKLEVVANSNIDNAVKIKSKKLKLIIENLRNHSNL